MADINTTPADRELLKWVAEELLGWDHRLSPSKIPGTDRWWSPDGISWQRHEMERHLQSWHGIGLVVEAFKAGNGNINRFNHYLEEGYDHWWLIREPWIHVFEAALKAVNGH